MRWGANGSKAEDSRGQGKTAEDRGGQERRGEEVFYMEPRPRDQLA